VLRNFVPKGVKMNDVGLSKMWQTVFVRKSGGGTLRKGRKMPDMLWHGQKERDNLSNLQRILRGLICRIHHC